MPNPDNKESKKSIIQKKDLYLHKCLKDLKDRHVSLPYPHVKYSISKLFHLTSIWKDAQDLRVYIGLYFNLNLAGLCKGKGKNLKTLTFH